MKVYHKAFAIIFMIALIGFAIFNGATKFYEIKTSLSEIEQPKELEDIKEYTAQIDSALVGNLLFDHAWNEAYAMVYNALDKNEENSFKYVRDKDGMLYSGNFWNTPTVPASEYVIRINVVKKKVEDKDTKVVVLLYPCQYNEKWSNGYDGIPYSDYNEMIDDMTAYFRYYSIDYINYRDFFLEKGWKATDIFFKTDHHWTTLAAFEGYKELVRYLNEEFDENLDTYYTDEENYKFITYEDCFIGSQGRDAGVNYVGLDDYTLITPKFPTDYYFSYTSRDNVTVEQEGDIQKTLINLKYLAMEDYYEKDMYCTYMDGIHLKETVINKKNEDGLNVLFIRDSYSSSLGTFFSSHCNVMDLMWSANMPTAVMEEAIEEGDYDYIFIGLAVDSYVNGGFDIYDNEVLTNE